MYDEGEQDSGSYSSGGDWSCLSLHIFMDPRRAAHVSIDRRAEDRFDARLWRCALLHSCVSLLTNQRQKVGYGCVVGYSEVIPDFDDEGGFDALYLR
jgi:hypothetical protein